MLLICTFLPEQKIFSIHFIFINIFGILEKYRFDVPVSNHFYTTQTKEVRHEDQPLHHTSFQLPAHEREKNTLRNYEFILGSFQKHFGDIDLSVISSEDIRKISKRLDILRRHAATYASRSGTPLEIVSKVLLRHSNLSTTQRYLGKISDAEAMRWIDNLHG